MPSVEQIENQEVHSARRAARAEQTAAILKQDADAETANALARIARDKEARNKRFAQWDVLIASDEFDAFLRSRGYCIRDAYEPLPYDPEAEQSVLGAIMMDASVLPMAIPPLCREHFRDESTRNVFDAIVKLRDHAVEKQRAPKVDMVTVASAMRRLKTFEEGTTLTLLSGCHEICPGSQNIAAYVEAVLHSAKQRYLWFLGQALSEEVLAPDAEPSQIINNAMRGLDAIEARGLCNFKDIFAPSK